MQIKEGKIYIGGESVTDIFNRHSGAFGHVMAVHVFDIGELRRRIKEMHSAIERTGVPLQLFYAMKANPEDKILDAMLDEGMSIDISSMREEHRLMRHIIKRVKSAEAFKRMSLTGTVVHPANMAVTGNRGSYINLGSLSTVEDFSKIRFAKGIKVNVGLRINLGIRPKKGIVKTSYSHLGIPLEDIGTAVKTLVESGTPPVTLHTHIGSFNLTSEYHEQALREMLKIAKDIPTIENINLGGGMGAAFAPDEQAFPFEEFCRNAKKILDKFERETGRKINLQAEPGEYLVANIGYYLTKVVDRQDRMGNLVVKGSAFHVPLNMSYGQYLPVYVEGRAGNSPGVATRKFNICGGTAHGGDRIMSGCELPVNVKKGDVLVIWNTGAYCGIASHSAAPVIAPSDRYSLPVVCIDNSPA